MNLSRRAVLLGVSAAAGGLVWRDPKAAAAETAADLVIFGGPIVTVNDAAADRRSGRRQGRQDRRARRGKRHPHASGPAPNTRVIDLGGKTLMPGFIDAHGHFMNAPRIVNWANVSLPPVGPVKSIPDIIKALQENMAAQKLAKGDWVMGYGYDSTGLAEKRRDDPRRSRSAFPRQSGDGDPRLQPRGGAQFAGAEDFRHHRRRRRRRPAA